jgi:molybdenum cofactor synthesis domain-containing protein
VRTAGIIIASTRAAAGLYQDECAPLIEQWLRGRGFDVAAVRVVKDGEPVRRALKELIAARAGVIITSGGTGLSEDDRTPEMTEPYLERQLPGIMEAMRRAGADKTPAAVLSRGVAGTVGGTFVVNLPGSPGGVRDGLAVLEPIIDHICGQLEGRNEH